MSDRMTGNPGRPPFLPHLSLSSCGGVCVLGDDAVVCSLFREERELLRTLLCGLRGEENRI